jgi:hypothetical protein
MAPGMPQAPPAQQHSHDEARAGVGQQQQQRAGIQPARGAPAAPAAQRRPISSAAKTAQPSSENTVLWSSANPAAVSAPSTSAASARRSRPRRSGRSAAPAAAAACPRWRCPPCWRMRRSAASSIRAVQHGRAEQPVGATPSTKCSGAQRRAERPHVAREGRRQHHRGSAPDSASTRRTPGSGTRRLSTRAPPAPATPSATAPGRSPAARRRSAARAADVQHQQHQVQQQPPPAPTAARAAARPARPPRVYASAASASSQGPPVADPDDRIIATVYFRGPGPARAAAAPMASTLTDRLSRLVKTMRGQARITEATCRTCCARCAWRCSKPTWRCRWCATSSPASRTRRWARRWWAR